MGGSITFFLCVSLSKFPWNTWSGRTGETSSLATFSFRTDAESGIWCKIWSFELCSIKKKKKFQHQLLMAFGDRQGRGNINGSFHFFSPDSVLVGRAAYHRYRRSCPITASAETLRGGAERSLNSHLFLAFLLCAPHI